MFHKNFTLVEIMIVMAIIGLLAIIAIPYYLRARENSHKSLCINNMRLIHGAVQQTLFEGGESTVLSDNDRWMIYIENDVVPMCPTGGDYSIAITGVECDNHNLNHQGLPIE